MALVDFAAGTMNGVGAPAAPARVTHAVFISLLAFIILPSRLLTGLHPQAPGLAASTANLLGVCAVWLLLWRLCVVRQSPPFLALAVAGVFLSAFRHPVVGAAIYIVLLLAHVWLRAIERRTPAGGGASAWDAAIESRESGVGREQAESHIEQATATPSVELVDLDLIVAPYVRLLVAIRTIRAAIASMLFVTLSTIPDALVSPALDGYEAMGGVDPAVVAGIPMTALAILVSLFFFKALRALWCGSVAALWGWFVLSIVVIPWSGVGLYLDTSRQDLLNGRVWLRAADFALHSILFVALAIGTAFVLRRRQHADFLALLRENRRRDWRTALLQLCGVVWPRRRWWTALSDRSVRWSILAFLLEGVGFFPMGSTNTTSTQALALLAPLPDSLSPLEGHYINLAVVVCLFAPGLFVWTQAMFRLADAARHRARRLALKPAGEARRLDERPPVLFLRSFENDQVSLRSASVASSVRLVDPAFEQAHLEDVLQTCLSLGPVIAVGRPSDSLPPVGVPRLYVPAAEWRNVVIDLMDDASLVVVGMSESAGVIWEIEQLTERRHLGKTVFVVPPEHARNRSLLHDLIRRVLPGARTVTWEHEVRALDDNVRGRRVVGVTCRADRARIFLTARRLSQVQYEAALRLGSAGA